MIDFEEPQNTMKTNKQMLEDLAAKFQKRLDRYTEKAEKATGTNKINQGAKIKATIECLQDVRVLLAKTNQCHD
jgi:hypothetical protein